MPSIHIEVSARHCHISREHLAILFGPGAKLTSKKELSQPGQFAAEERVTLRTADGEIAGIRILGPARSKTQIELSRTDARQIKLPLPLRHSGDTTGSPGATLIGPKGEVTLSEGLIVAKRHLHSDPATAAELGLTENQIVAVRTPGERGVLFENVLVRIHPDFRLAMHIDTDEGNASLPEGVCTAGELVIQ